jgi:serine/threonine-protein kinase
MADILDRLKAALADRYQIERELGSGGMATVYLAHDIRHDRPVAVKVLRPDLAAALGPDRFLQEIEIAANLSHPHILPLLDSGEADHFLYYVMPLVEGDSLRDRLNREKQLSVDEALKIASQVAGALSYAHSHDIVHRDIKPENILFQAGEVVVADFGVALAVDSAGGTRLTETGFSLGTPAYMSPEQVSGEQEIDGRSDIYSLACVLYEMLAGDPPFVASNPRAVLAKHMTDPAPPITTVRSGVPVTVAAALNRALGKAPVDRFESAKAFSDALLAEAKEVEPEIKSIVVLPFENLSPDPDNAFFADGLTEELIAELSGLKELRVISRTSAMQFKDTKKGVPTIARELNVRYALEGSVRRVADSVRITAQLIDASTDSHLWAERYTGKLDDIFDLQEQLSRRIVEALRVALTPEEDDRLASRSITDIHAYDAWLRARQELWKFSKEGTERAIRLIEQAQAITGENALLHAALGFIHARSYEFGISHDDERLQQADEHASRALELAPNLGVALLAKGYVRFKEGDFHETARLLRRATRQGRDTEVLCQLAIVLAMVGKIDEARKVSTEALSLDPLYVFTGFSRALVDFLDGRFEAAADRFQKILDDLSPDDPMIMWWLAQAMAHTGRLDEARQVFARVSATDAVTLADTSELYCRATEGDRDGVAKLIDDKVLLVEAAKTDEWFPNIIANCLLMVANEEGALQWLDRAVEWGFCNYRYLQEYNPFLKPLHGNPTFQRLIDKARQKHEAFDA